MDKTKKVAPKDKTKASKVYGCPKCSYRANRFYNVQRHLANHYEKPPKELQHLCQVAGCNFSTMRWDNLSRHQQRVHNITKPRTEPEDEVQNEISEVESLEQQAALLPSDEHLALLLSEENPLESAAEESTEPIPSKDQTETPPISKETKPKEKRISKPRKNYKSGKIKFYECTTCDYSTNRGYNIKRHIEKHMVKQGAELMLHVCVIAGCGFSTPRWDNLRRHVKRVHPETEAKPEISSIDS